jgi:hypothetical protein
VCVGPHTFYEADSWRPLFAAHQAGERQGMGFEFPRVALCLGFRALLNLDHQSPWLQGAGPALVGECAVHDVELGLQPRIAVAIGFPKRSALPEHIVLQVRVVTDVETRREAAPLDPKARATFTFREGLRGQRLRRLDLDLLQPAAGDSPAVAWSASLPCDRPLAVKEIDLGLVKLTAIHLQVHGRVVDETGAPVASASVIIKAGETDAYQLTTDAAGAFAYLGALFRDSQGALLPVVAQAVLGKRRSEPSAPVAAGGEVTLMLPREAAPPPPQPRADGEAAPPPPRPATRADGSVRARIPGIKPEQAATVTLLDAGNIPHQPAAVRPAGEGVTEFTFEHLRQGRYTLCVVEPGQGRLPLLQGLDVPGDGPCPDARLQAVGLRESVQFVTVRVVDGQKVPIAGATVSGSAFNARTDGTGSARLPRPREGVTVEFTAPGCRDLRLTSLEEGQVVMLEPAGVIAVTVKGIPADLPRGHLQVWVREEPRERLAGPKAMLGDGDVARVTLPARGRYVLWLLVSTKKDNTSEYWSSIASSPEALVIGDAREQTAVLQLDDAAAARLRKELGKQ